MGSVDLPFRPRNLRVLVVLIIARISTVHQDRRSLDDQVALCRAYVTARYQGVVQFEIIQGQGSGEHLDRKDLADAEARVESGGIDLVVVEDLGRICRRNRALDFCELAEDADTRLIAINDHIDTHEGNWRLNAFFASFKHEMSNADTAARIRRSLRNRFTTGQLVQFVIYGYVKPPGAESDADLRKDPTAEPVYDQIFIMLENGASYWEVSDWLNAHGVKPGPYSRSDRWDGRMVARVVFNPILKGVRVRNNRMSKRVNKCGRRKSVKAPPSERLERHCPHLAFIDPARYDRLIALLTRRNEVYRRAGRQGVDSRSNVPRGRTRWPGQHVRCGVCGRLFYWGGHGQADRMMCAGVRDFRCWNTVTFDGPDAAGRIADAVLFAVEALPGFDPAFAERVRANADAARGRREEAERRLAREAADVEQALGRVLDAVQKLGHSDALAGRLRELEQRRHALGLERDELKGRRDELPPLPGVDELKTLARARLGPLAIGDPEFGRVMRQLLPHVLVFPVRAIDSDRLVARAFVTLDLAGLLPGGLAEAAGGLLRQELWVDLFNPPQRVEYREQVVALRAQGLTERQVADGLGLTQPIVQRGLRLDRLMAARGLTDPYELLTGPPAGRKYKQHLHPRYRFEPLESFPAWPARPTD